MIGYVGWRALGRAALVLGLSGVGWSCTAGRGAMQAVGFLPGNQGATAFDVPADVWMAEVLPIDVPQPVVDAAALDAAERGWRIECYRFFVADDKVVVIPWPDCGRDTIVKGTDSQELMGFRKDGRAIGVILWFFKDGEAEIRPLRRRDPHP